VEEEIKPVEEIPQSLSIIIIQKRQLLLGDNSSLSIVRHRLPNRGRLYLISIQTEMFSSTAIKMRILSIQIA